ncbi:ribonuclease E [Lipingzhangella halophila]|uniref:Ribonuclease E n=1 Tax=Lipingzhangella halophila TaxID=1783352 RepID=A0A7W7RJQ8_9ACTN|nr:ribonuclease E [Lipingzhangella halophila]
MAASPDTPLTTIAGEVGVATSGAEPAADAEPGPAEAANEPSAGEESGAAESAAEEGAAEVSATAGSSAEDGATEGATAESATGTGTRPARASRSRTRRTAAARSTEEPPAPSEDAAPGASADEDGSGTGAEASDGGAASTFQPPMVLFQPPVAHTASAGSTPARDDRDDQDDSDDSDESDDAEAADSTDETSEFDGDDGDSDEDRPSRRRRRRGGRGRGKSRPGDDGTSETDTGGTANTAVAEEERSGTERTAEPAEESQGTAREATAASTEDTRGTRRRRRRRRTAGEAAEATEDTESVTTGDDPPNTVVKVREPRQEKQEKQAESEVQSVKGSTRLEAKKQRRREGREQGRRRAPVITESEFLARRESVKRDLVIRRNGDRTQIAVLEDDVLVEHYVDRAAHKSYVGNVYLGRVQNVLPSMEAAFVDIGKGRNAVLYAGEVNWDASGLEGQPKRIESVLKSGQSVLVQVTKDPMGHKGARLTSQISLPGRYLVYVPDGSMTGISRKLPDKERTRLKQILKKVMPENAGVIVRTAAEGASEEELERDISRLSSQWESIKRKSKSATSPSLLSSEPDLTVRVVRDVFNEDFASLVVAGDEAWSTVKEYVDYVAPHLAERLTHWDGERDVFEEYRVDEQIAKALERKVWLPSGGSLIIDRTEAMTVVDVNTGKFTGQGGNLEETVTKNNLEAAEEIVRQLRLRDIGGIIVIDFIDMVLESNRDLVLRRMLECLSRDRTKHQVAEVTSLGLVQMTRKRVGQGLLEAFSHTCESCNGRGLVLSSEPAETKGGSSSAGSAAGSGGSANGKKKKAKSGSDKAGKGEITESAQTSEVSAEAPAGDGEAEPAAAAEAPAEPETTTAKSSSRQAAKGTTRKSGAKQSTRKTKKDKEAAAATAAETADGEAAEPAAAEGASAEAAGTEATGEAETGAERPRRRRTRRTKTTGPASEAASASAVAEAG